MNTFFSKFYGVILFICSLSLWQAQANSQAIDVSSGEWDGIVKIDVTFLQPDYKEPWNTGKTGAGSGTGFYIGNNQFLTNAHVVSDSSKIVLRITNDPTPYAARIKYIAHDCDLAIIEAIDASHFSTFKPLTIGDVPKLNTEVVAIGYPLGGERISVTRGVISRIEFNTYAHSEVDSHMSIQVDAAINPGNSGGPVLQDSKVVGVAFQGYNGNVAQNVAYMIPTPVIKRFLKDIEDGNYDHYADFAISDFAIENEAQRTALGIKEQGIGIMVGKVEKNGTADGILEAGDVILSLDGNKVFSNGLIRIDGELIHMMEVVERKFTGDKIKLEFIHKKEIKTTELTLKRFFPYLRQGNQYNKRPEYIVYAGLVFQPLSKNLMIQNQIQHATTAYWFDHFINDQLYHQIEEPVILSSILDDEVNADMSIQLHNIVDKINGKPIRKLKDISTALEATADNPNYIVIEMLDNPRPSVLHRQKAKESHERIMKNYAVNKASYLAK